MGHNDLKYHQNKNSEADPFVGLPFVVRIPKLAPNLRSADIPCSVEYFLALA
jgi:hypothetical protein